MSEQRTVNVYLTAQQCRYLGGVTIEHPDVKDAVITMVDDSGGIFVEQASTCGEEGSGVWVDALGNEHYGPGASFAESKDATELARR